MAEKVKLLLIDDDVDVLLITSLLLGLDSEIEVFTALSGAQGLEKLEDRTLDLAGILVDSRMPGMSGADFLSNVLASPRLSKIPVVFLTASVRETDVANFMALGAIGVIAKPYDPLALAGQVRDLLSKQ